MTETTVPTAPVAADQPPRGTKLARLGFLMVAVGPLVMLVASAVFGMELDDVVFFVLPLVPAVIGAVLVRRPQKAAKVVALVLVVIAGGLNSWTIFGITEPTSFFDFVPGTLVLPGALLALGAGIAAIRAKGRTVGSGEQRAVTSILGALGVLALLSVVMTVTGRETVDADDAAAADLEVDLEDFEFDRGRYDSPGGATVLVKNSDPFVHTFTVEELDIDVDMGPFSEKLVTLPDEPGTYVLFCEPHTSDPDDPADGDMAAVLTIG